MYWCVAPSHLHLCVYPCPPHTDVRLHTHCTWIICINACLCVCVCVCVCVVFTFLATLSAFRAPLAWCLVHIQEQLAVRGKQE